MNMEQNQTDSKPITRRDFLKTSSVAASATALGVGCHGTGTKKATQAGTAAAALTIERAAHAAGNDILKVGMIGCGGRNAGAAGQALNADPGTRLVAMCDIFRDRIEAKREEL